MELIVKEFDELSNLELLEIMKLRISVFVVEQKCPYMEIDEYDERSIHVYLKDENKIVAYARVLPKGCTYQSVSIGRVLAIKRRMGFGTRIVKEAISVAKDRFKADKIEIGAQCYVKKMYENIGFVQVSNEYLEDGIPHIDMKLIL